LFFTDIACDEVAAIALNENVNFLWEPLLAVELSSVLLTFNHPYLVLCSWRRRYVDVQFP
jgi:hypothetical protein